MAERDRLSDIVGIIGAGARARDLATACLAAGWRVRLSDVDAVATADVASYAVVVIEAVGTEPDLKRHVFRELDAAVAADTVLATAADGLSVEACAMVTRRPERVIGLRPWPALLETAVSPQLVEVAVTEWTSAATLETTMTFVSALGSTAVVCADAPGFIVDRVGRAYLLEAVRLLEEGRGTVAGIDAALEAAGYAMGPFRLIDRIGLDVDLATTTALHEAFHEAARFRPPWLQQDLVEQGRLGRAHGRGFYRYGTDGSATPSLDVEVLAPLSDDEVVERLELAVINEAYRAVGERVAAAPDVDLAMCLGAGHPRGPFERVDQLGLRRIVERLRVLHAMTIATSGDQYAVAPALWQMATV